MGTSHCGSDLAELAVIVSKFLQYFRRANHGTLEILQQKSEVMARILQDFHAVLRDRDPSKDSEIAIICFYEELPVRAIGEVSYIWNDHKLSTDPRKIVPKVSASLDSFAFQFNEKINCGQ